MRVEQVEIYSDTTNAAVMRPPARRFPGSLMQGDSLYILCALADEACRRAKEEGCDRTFSELNDLRNKLWDRLNDYKQVLAEHNIFLPFSEQSR
jgi:uncharacterized iron-regulated protein